MIQVIFIIWKWIVNLYHSLIFFYKLNKRKIQGKMKWQHWIEHSIQNQWTSTASSMHDLQRELNAETNVSTIVHPKLMKLWKVGHNLRNKRETK